MNKEKLQTLRQELSVKYPEMKDSFEDASDVAIEMIALFVGVTKEQKAEYKEHLTELRERI